MLYINFTACSIIFIIVMKDFSASKSGEFFLQRKVEQ